MRIFNWVNRKLHHKDGQHEYCRGIGKEVVKERRVEYEGIDVEAVDALLLNGWTAGGILTIGTLGLMVLGDHGGVESKGSEDYYDVEEEEEETCLVNNNGDLDSNNEEEEEYEDEEDLDDDDHCLIIMETKEEETQKMSNYDHKTRDYYVPHNKEMLGVVTTTTTEKKKERTTLADLFSAEYSDDIDYDVGKTRKSSVHNIRRIWPTTAYHFKANPAAKKRDQTTNGATTTASSLSFAKRLIPLTGIDKQPVKKFHKLMRRMLNRKIHPELGGKLASKTDDSTDEAQPSCEVANIESISLLRTRD